MADTSNDHLQKGTKITGRDFYENLGSPKVILAPMVDRSEFAWRILSRCFMDPDTDGTLLAYSPMFHARLFNETQRFRDQHFQPIKRCATLTRSEENIVEPSQKPYLDGRPDIDRPLTVQFCANDPDQLLEAAQHVQGYCDAVDLNLGCPQGIARSGKYGAFLQEDQDLIYRLINKLHHGLKIPVTAKIRVLDTREATLAYAKNVLSAGASILTVHGRRREQKGHYTGLADWSIIRYLRENLPADTVLFANGNILRHQDIAACLEATGADAVMVADANLHDPTVFAARPLPGSSSSLSYWESSVTGKGGFRVDYVFRRYMSIIYRYVLEEPEPMRPPLYDPQDPSTVEPVLINPHLENTDGPPAKKRKKAKRSTPISVSLTAMQGHLFQLLRPLVMANTNVRDALAKARPGDLAAFEYVLALTEQAVRHGLEAYARDPTLFEDPSSGEKTSTASLVDIINHESSQEAVKACKMPWWVCQSHVRPLPVEAMEKGSIILSNKQLKQKASTGELKQVDPKMVLHDDIQGSKDSTASINPVKDTEVAIADEVKAAQEPTTRPEVRAPAMICG